MSAPKTRTVSMHLFAKSLKTKNASTIGNICRNVYIMRSYAVCRFASTLLAASNFETIADTYE